MIKLYEDIVKHGYSVRKVEQLVQELTNPKKAEKKTNTELQEVYTPWDSNFLRCLERLLK